MALGTVLWFLDHLITRDQKRRRVKVLVHEAVFLARDSATGATLGSEPHYFIKVTNLSDGREIELTHVWYDGKPQVHLFGHIRPLPARLRPDETWEDWVRVADVAHIPEVEWAGRVRLSSTKVLKGAQVSRQTGRSTRRQGRRMRQRVAPFRSVQRLALSSDSAQAAQLGELRGSGPCHRNGRASFVGAE
jgi:hypothetical protein